MLALSRKKGESIIIGEGIEITILEVQGEQIKIGIQAPKHIPIYRKEIYIQIQDENKNAIKTNKDSMEKLKTILKKNL